MGDVKRYDMEGVRHPDYPVSMEETFDANEGEWVRHEDHAREVEALKASLSESERAVNLVRNALIQAHLQRAKAEARVAELEKHASRLRVVAATTDLESTVEEWGVAFKAALASLFAAVPDAEGNENHDGYPRT